MSTSSRDLLAFMRDQHTEAAIATSQACNALHEKLVKLFEAFGVYQDLADETTKLMARLQPLLQQDVQYQQYASLPLAQFLHALLTEYSQSAKLFYRWRHHHDLVNALIAELPTLCLEAVNLASPVMSSSSSSTTPTLAQVGLENSSFRMHFLVQVMQYIANYYTLEQLSKLTAKGDFIKLLKMFIHKVELLPHIKSLNQISMTLPDADRPVFTTVFVMTGFYFNMYAGPSSHHQAIIPHIHFLRDSILHGFIDDTLINKIHHNYQQLSDAHLYFNRNSLGKNTYFIIKLTSKEQINVSLREILRIATLKDNQKEKVVAYIETLSPDDALDLFDGVALIFSGNFWLELDGNFLFYRNVINEILVMRHRQINKEYLLDKIIRSKTLFDIFIELVLEKSQVSHFIVSVLTELKDDFLKNCHLADASLYLMIKNLSNFVLKDKENIKELLFFIKLMQHSIPFRSNPRFMAIERKMLDIIEKHYKCILDADESAIKLLRFLTKATNDSLYYKIISYYTQKSADKDLLSKIRNSTKGNPILDSILMRSHHILPFLINYFSDNKNTLTSLFESMDDIPLGLKDVNELFTGLYTLYQWRNSSTISIHEVLNTLINQLEPQLTDAISQISWDSWHAMSLIDGVWERVQAALIARQEPIHAALAGLSERYQLNNAYIHPDTALMFLRARYDADVAIRQENERLERFVADLRRERDDTFPVPEAFVRLVTYHSGQVASTQVSYDRVNRVVDTLVSFLSLPPVLQHENYHESIKSMLIHWMEKRLWFVVDRLLDFMHELHMVIPRRDMSTLLRSAVEQGADLSCFNKIRRLNPRFHINIDWINAVRKAAVNASAPYTLWHVFINHHRLDLLTNMLAIHYTVPYPLTLVNHAIAKGNLEIVKALLDAHPNYDFMSQLEKDSRIPQYQPAHHAILIDRLDILEALWVHYQNQQQSRMDTDIKTRRQHEKAERQFSKYLAKKKARADGVNTSHCPFSKRYHKYLAKQQAAIYGSHQGILTYSSPLIPNAAVVLSQSSESRPTCSSSLLYGPMLASTSSQAMTFDLQKTWGTAFINQYFNLNAGDGDYPSLVHHAAALHRTDMMRWMAETLHIDLDDLGFSMKTINHQSSILPVAQQKPQQYSINSHILTGFSQFNTLMYALLSSPVVTDEALHATLVQVLNSLIDAAGLSEKLPLDIKGYDGSAKVIIPLSSKTAKVLRDFVATIDRDYSPAAQTVSEQANEIEKFTFWLEALCKMVAQAITQFTMEQWQETPGYSLSGHQSFFGDKAQRMLAVDMEPTTFYQSQLDALTRSPVLF